MTSTPDAARPAVMTDVARLAGVSHQTVSRVLNNHPSVRPDTRERVMRAVTELSYRPNAMARGLASRRSRVLGVVSFDTILFGPASTLLGIERAARGAGYGVSIVALERVDRAGVLSAVDGLAAQGVDGIIIIAPQMAAQAALHSLPRGLPAVAVETGQDGVLPAVSVDQAEGARLAVRHLVELGHRTVWHVAGPGDWLEARDRVHGWRAALEEAGCPVPPVISGDWGARSGFTAGAALTGRDAVTAVFTANDQMALGLLRALHERGVRVPQDISVVGFDDIPEAEFMLPPLTTVRQDFDEVGRRSIAALLRIVEGADEDSPEPPPAVVPPTLVIRRSTAPPRA
ncbi:LacI family DNA-binding transcriptional regulator [Catenuloplanes indicus]|uniref:LacI family transcriptional regulator n=1 Tax=Catenuloplanes indicus TaxID=137267 RepID=A0AAE3W295_9ACTN|nr:LacI family DNA-binding transcriptional regulator [Catenuloplanes indicus]MDQ0368378.1 LacI family transcriptional regulator [Catenuloplanes indicus]